MSILYQELGRLFELLKANVTSVKIVTEKDDIWRLVITRITYSRCTKIESNLKMTKFSELFYFIQATVFGIQIYFWYYRKKSANTYVQDVK